MKSQQPGSKIAIYSRKSKFTGKGESVENQIELCRQYIKLHYDHIDENAVFIYEDEGFSGGHTDRPQFKQMMRHAREKKFSTIICYRLDRISRNIGDFAGLIEELNGLQISFVSIKERFDTSSPLGRAMMYIASVFSQLERETIAERIRDNMQELAKTGRWLGGITPTGYSSEPVEKVTVDGKVRKAYKLEIIPEEARLVKLIYDKFLEVSSLTKTETYLLQQHITTKNGRQFTRFSIKNILENPAYLIADKDAWQYFERQSIELFAQRPDFDGKHGIMAYNKTLQKRGKRHQARDLSEWIVAVGKHAGIINGADWLKVRQLLEQNKDKAYHKPKNSVALLSGLLFCGNCGEYMRPKLTQRTNVQGEPVYTYLCQTKEKSRGCNCNIQSPSGNLLDKLICGEIGKLTTDSAVIIGHLETGCHKILGNRTEISKQLERLRKAHEANGKEISSLVLSLAKSVDTPAHDYITTEINGLHEKGEDIKREIEELESLTQEHMLSNIELDAIRCLLSSFADTFADMNVQRKRAALRTIVNKILWDGENAHLYLLGTDDCAEKKPQWENSK